MINDVKTPSYQEGLKELRANLTNMLPQESLEIFDGDAKQLENNHRSIVKLQQGDSAPNFTLTNAVGEKVELSKMLESSRVVLTFYRGTWCPYCNLQLAQYQQVLEEIHAYGAQLVAISPQTPDESLNIREKNELKYEVLSDNGNIVAKEYTTVFRNGEEPLEAMKALGIDFDSFYSDNSKELPIPAVFIIEKDGSVSFAKAMGGDYRNRVEASEIIENLKK